MTGALHMTGADPDEVWPLVRDHHYSGRMPANIQNCYAVRTSGGLFGDHGDVQAAIVFSVPPTRWTEEVLELSRLVRLPNFAAPLSMLVSFACGWVKKNGNWPLVVSFADRTQSHHGGIYQACGWSYDGCRERAMDGVLIDGVFKPGRSCNSAWGTRSPTKLSERLPGRTIEAHYDEGKHLYWRPLLIAGRARARRLGLRSMPYPKPAIRPADERDSIASEAGATPADRSNSLGAA